MFTCCAYCIVMFRFLFQINNSQSPLTHKSINSLTIFSKLLILFAVTDMSMQTIDQFKVKKTEDLLTI